LEEIKRIDRKLVKKCHVFDLYEDTILSPTGHVAHWDFLKHNGAAAVVPVTEDGKILLVRQYRNAIDRISLEIPAGKRDTVDEPTLTCAIRELEEETGYQTRDMELLIRVVTAIAYCDETIDIYVARNLKPSKQRLDEDEFIDVEAYSLEELEQMVLNYEIRDSKTIAAIMAYANKYGNKERK